jgi:hypothetical protein
MMRLLKKLGGATAVSLVAACGLVGSASATTIEPANTEFTMTSTNSRFIVDTTPVSCGSSVLTGDTGALTHTTWASATVTTLAYTGCTAFGLATTVTPREGCHTPAGRPILHGMGVNATAIGTITLPASCSIDIAISMTSCAMTITGGQTIGNGTAGTGGIDWTNLGAGGAKSVAHFNYAHIPVIDSNGAIGCPASPTATGTLTGDYNITSATNITITP